MQYTGGAQYKEGAQYTGGAQYTRECHDYTGDVTSSLRGVQYNGGISLVRGE